MHIGSISTTLFLRAHALNSLRGFREPLETCTAALEMRWHASCRPWENVLSGSLALSKHVSLNSILVSNSYYKENTSVCLNQH